MFCVGAASVGEAEGLAVGVATEVVGVGDGPGVGLVLTGDGDVRPVAGPGEAIAPDPIADTNPAVSSTVKKGRVHGSAFLINSPKVSHNVPVHHIHNLSPGA